MEIEITTVRAQVMRKVVSLPAGLPGLSTNTVSAVKIFIFQPLLGCPSKDLKLDNSSLPFQKSYFTFCLGRWAKIIGRPLFRFVVFITFFACSKSSVPKLTQRFKGTRLAPTCQLLAF
jgi:hypothetical protein